MLLKIISGGQTGADRAALDFAIARGIPHGGWCPRGCLAEDGAIPARYHLRETPDSDYSQRTEWNVRDSDGTVIFSIAPTLSGGSRQTADLAQRYQKPCFHLSRERDSATAPGKLRDFLASHDIQTLNVAGPRQSEAPEVAAFTAEVLEQGI
jgi:Circularly permutated YpsA SLOG family